VPGVVDEFDPHHFVSGRKILRRDLRAKRSTIDLRNYVEPQTERAIKKVPSMVCINTRVQAELDRRYEESTDNYRMSLKDRSVSLASPFHVSNHIVF
jgi:hypothetical protein